MSNHTYFDATELSVETLSKQAIKEYKRERKDLIIYSIASLPSCFLFFGFIMIAVCIFKFLKTQLKIESLKKALKQGDIHDEVKILRKILTSNETTPYNYEPVKIVTEQAIKGHKSLITGGVIAIIVGIPGSLVLIGIPAVTIGIFIIVFALIRIRRMKSNIKNNIVPREVKYMKKLMDGKNSYAKVQETLEGFAS